MATNDRPDLLVVFDQPLADDVFNQLMTRWAETYPGIKMAVLDGGPRVYWLHSDGGGDLPVLSGDDVVEFLKSVSRETTG